MEPTSPPGWINRLIRVLLSWANPAQEPLPGLSDESWRTQYEELSKTVWNLVSIFVAACAFCVILLSAPDTSLFSADAKITIPVISLSVSYTEFLFFAPLFLSGFAIYIHVFLEQLLRLRLYKRQRPSVSEPSGTYLFNLDRPVANFGSAFLFYGLLPAVLAYFVWKTIPRPAAPWPLSLALVSMTGVMLALAIRRFPAIRPQPLTAGDRARIGVRWALLIACAVLFVPLLWTTGQIVYTGLTVNPDQINDRLQRIHPQLRATSLFRIRRLNLFGSNMAHQDLSGFYAPYADLRHADFTGSDLEGADLSHSDLTRATLTGANLGGAELKSSVIDFTAIDLKWRAVWCIVNSHLNNNDECLPRNSLAWLDLSTANLRNSDFSASAAPKSKAVQSNGANLRYADLTGANLTGVKFRLADLRDAILPSMNDADVDGALFKGRPPTGWKPEAVLYIQNRSSGSCLSGPKIPLNQTLPKLIYPCPARADPLFQWWGKRLPNGSVTLHAAGPGSDGRKGCLDGTSVSDDRIPVQMWECDPDYENQYWTLTPVDDQYVILQKNNTNYCLDGTGTRDGTPVPILMKCSNGNRNQDWRVTFEEEEKDAREVRTREAAEKRARDLNDVSRHYRVAPFFGGYESRGGEESPRRARESREFYYRAGRRP